MMIQNQTSNSANEAQATEITPESQRAFAARPKSDWSPVVGWLGVAGVLLWVAIARVYQLHQPFWSVFTVLTAAIPMVLWSVLVDKVHRNPSTGIDWDAPPRQWADIKDISITKIISLWATWGMIAFFYCIGRWYWTEGTVFAMHVFMWIGIPLLLISIPYVIWLDRRLVEPKDHTYAFGLWVLGRSNAGHMSAVYDHLRAWAVKGFFIAFMVAILPGGYHHVITMPIIGIWQNPVAIVATIVALMFLFDVHVAMVGYLLTLRPLDAHIRSANPFLAGWVSALICYPPFIMMGANGPLNYTVATYGDDGWWQWTQSYPTITWVLAGAFIFLSAIYAWATIAFGLRFSNLTYRGVLTDGPYRFTRHPAYISKNSFWWIATLPFLVTTNNINDSVRNVAALLLVNLVYYWRAKTEEKHLLVDPKYVDYWNWAERHALVTSAINRLFRKTPRTEVLREEPHQY